MRKMINIALAEKRRELVVEAKAHIQKLIDLSEQLTAACDNDEVTKALVAELLKTTAAQNEAIEQYDRNATMIILSSASGYR